VKVTSDVRELERVINDQGFYVDIRLRRSSDDDGHWLTSHPSDDRVVIDDDTACTGREPVVHPCFTDPCNNCVFHSLAQVTHVLTQLQVYVERCIARSYKKAVLSQR